MRTKIVVKKDVKEQIEHLKKEFDELIKCVNGHKINKQIELGIDDDTKLADTNYTFGELAQVDIYYMEDCIERINTELKLLSKTVKRDIE